LRAAGFYEEAGGAIAVPGPNRGTTEKRRDKLNFNNRGYLVSKDNGKLFLSRSSTQSSGGAIGQGGTNWSPTPNVECLFSDQQEASRLAKTHGGNVIEATIDVKVEEGQTA
jgi:hypothetical protein